MPRQWTTKELQYLKENAGRMPPEQLAQRLNRSKNSIQKQAAKNKISLRYYRRINLVWCNSCCKWRSKLKERELCRVCSEEKLLEKKTIVFSELMKTAPPELAKERNARETTSGTKKFDRRPRLIDVKGMSAYHQTKAAKQNSLLIEQWEWNRVHRKARAMQKRIERLRKAISSF